jgi:hypothetical protein
MLAAVATAQEPAPLPPPSQPVKAVQSLSEREKSLPLRPAGQSRLEVEIIPEAAISAENKQIIAAAQQELRSRAAIDAISLNDHGWTIEQIACPAFPHSIVLRYTAGKSARDRSEFIASIAGDGREVGLIPIVRKGYSVYSPMPANAMTIGAINTMLAREDAKPPVSQIAVCYAALIGAKAETAPDGKSVVKLEVPPAIKVPVAGDETVLVTTRGLPPQSWSLEFDHRGKLLKAEPVTGGAMVVRRVIPAKDLPQGKPVSPETNKQPGDQAAPAKPQ